MNKKYLYIGFAALFGVSLRAAIGMICQGLTFPFSILAINIVASFSLVVLYQYVRKRSLLPDMVTTAIGTGLIGSFSTLSAVAYDTSIFVLNDQIAEAVLNYSANMLLCLMAAFAGLACSKALAKRQEGKEVRS